MDNFVILFRQGKRHLNESEKQRRAEETAVWARQVNAAGHALEPHILGPGSRTHGAELPATQNAEAWTVTALLFLRARDIDDAAAVAESHPALRHGASVEIRPWAPPGRN